MSFPKPSLKIVVSNEDILFSVMYGLKVKRV
jgi:hypothetical protein